MTANYRVTPGDVTHERLDDEVLAINLATGLYYSMAGVAADCWDSIAAGCELDLLSAALSERFDAFRPEHLDQFVTSLVTEGLVREASSDGAAPTLRVSRYAAPVVERHGDLQELLLIDPIHDVGETGWPVRSE